MSTIKKHLWYHIGMPRVNTKTLVAVVILVLLLLGAFALSSRNNAGKNTSAPAFIPPSSSENTIPAGVVDSEPEEDPVFVPAGECPEGQMLSSEGECLPNDEAGQVEEPAQLATVDYTKLLYPYEERDSHNNHMKLLWDNVDGHPLYSRVLEYDPGKNLVASIGYLNNDGKWVEDKRFLTTVVYGYSAKQPETADYHGSFVKLDNPSYSGVGLIFGVWSDNPIRLNPRCSSYESGEGVFRACVGASPDPVVYTGK